MQRGAESLENRVFSGFLYLPLSSVKFRQVRFWQLDSKCRVPKRNLGFESLTLRQKPSHIKAFAHMTGLFFLRKVTLAHTIFGKNSGVPAGLPCVRQSQDSVTKAQKRGSSYSQARVGLLHSSYGRARRYCCATNGPNSPVSRKWRRRTGRDRAHDAGRRGPQRKGSPASVYARRGKGVICSPQCSPQNAFN